MKSRFAAVALAAALASASACGASSASRALPSHGGDATAHVAPRRYPTVDLAATAQRLKLEADDDGRRDPRALLTNDRVDTVVVGTIGSVAQGPDLGGIPNDPSPEETTALHVNVLSTLKGRPHADGTVYVELFGWAGETAMRKALPHGALVVVYGRGVPADELYTQDPSRGKPEGATFVRPGSIGLSVVNPTGGIVYPTIGEVYPTWGVEQLIPAVNLPEVLQAVGPLR